MFSTLALGLFFIVTFLTSILRRRFVRRDIDLRRRVLLWRRLGVLPLRKRSRRNNAAHHGCHQNSLQTFHNYLWPPHVSYKMSAHGREREETRRLIAQQYGCHSSARSCAQHWQSIV